jgi:hypothetical protein
LPSPQDSRRAGGIVRVACHARHPSSIGRAETLHASAATEFSFIRKKNHYRLKSGRLPDIEMF